MFRMQSLRLRIASAYIVGALVVSGLVAGGTFFISQWVLMRQAIDSAKTDTYEGLEFLKDRVVLDPGPGQLRTYLQTLQQRGSEVVVRTAGIESAETTSVGVTEGAIPKELRDGVQDGKVGYAIYDGPGHRELAWGSPVPPGSEQIFTYWVYSLEDVDRTLALLWRVLLGVVAAAGAIAGAVGLRLADRTIRPLRDAATAARRVAAGGLETRLEVTGEDELGRLANDFNSMAQALEDRIVRERQFISDVSHELRTPLTAIKASIDYIADKGADLPDRMRSAVGLAADEVASLRRLIDDLLELTRADAGGVQISWDDVDLRNFAAEVARRRAPNTPVHIEGPDELVVRTDKLRLERVVGNLVENAVVHGGGEEVLITLEADNGTAKISVLDKGPGIEDEQIPRIFERFWRGDASRSRDGAGGSGLGLAIAHENAKLIGADLLVASVTGEGTRFEVLIPYEAGNE